MLNVTRRQTFLLAAGGVLLSAAPAEAEDEDFFDAVRDAMPVQLRHVVADGMAPTIPAGSVIAVDQTSAALASFARGDVIVFDESYSGASFVKRVIGLPNERVRFADGAPVINDVALRQERLHPYEGSLGEYWGQAEVWEMAEFAPEGSSWRVLETDTASAIDNTPEITVPADALFVVGDFRDNSYDSRARDIGPIEISSVTGKIVNITPPGG